jgi:hypothetical protein
MHRYAEGMRPPMDRCHIRQPDLFGASHRERHRLRRLVGFEAVRIQRVRLGELLDQRNREDVHAAVDRCHPLRHRRDTGGRAGCRLHRLGKRHAVRVQRRRFEELHGNRHRQDLYATMDLRTRRERVFDVFVAGRGERRRLLLLDQRRDLRVRRGRIAELLGLRHCEDVLSDLGRRYWLHRRRIACHRQRSPLHQRLW